LASTRFAGAEIRWSGPAAFCNWPIASISARRALPFAANIASACDEERSEIVESDNNPTASTVSSTISDKEITKAKP